MTSFTVSVPSLWIVAATTTVPRYPSTGVARPGVPLQLAFHVTRPLNGECFPLEGMRIDIWHCDALGRYSDFRREGTAGQQFLRGYQVTGRDGRV